MSRTVSRLTRTYNSLLVVGCLVLASCVGWRVASQVGRVDLYLRQEREEVQELG